MVEMTSCFCHCRDTQAIFYLLIVAVKLRVAMKLINAIS